MKRVIIAAIIGSIVPFLALAVAGPRLRLDSAEAQAAATHRFAVEIDGIPTAFFKSVSGLEIETEVVDFLDGTGPTIIRKLPGRTKYANIVLKQGFVSGADPFFDWYQEIIGGTVKKRRGSVVLLTSDLKEVGRYNFYEAWPCKWQGIEAVGNGSAIAIEKVELAVERIEKAR
jgi:phage tail-like protein